MKETSADREFRKTVYDQKATAYLGLYYSEKVMGAVDLKIYNETQDEKFHTSSVGHLKKALEYWKQYVTVATAQYRAHKPSRQGYIDLNELTSLVEKEIKIAESWKPRKM
jgi:hypothetical protein